MRGGGSGDGKSGDAGEWGDGVGFFFADVVGEFAVFFDFGEEGVEFVGVVGHDIEFDAAVGEIADGAGDVEAGGDSAGGVAEADALDAA